MILPQSPGPPTPHSALQNAAKPPCRRGLPPSSLSQPPTSEAGPAPLDFRPRDIEAHVGAAASQLSFGTWAAPRRARLPPGRVLLHGAEGTPALSSGGERDPRGHGGNPPSAYKSDVLGGDVVVDAVARPVVTSPPGLREALAGAGGVVADEAGALHQEVEDEARQLHADGDEEEDNRVLLLVRQQQLGEDAAERDDDPGGAWWHGRAISTGSR